MCGKHVVGPDPEGLLARVGADTIVCLNQAHELVDRYPHYLDWLRSNVPDRAVWFPVPDLHAPSADEARPFLDELLDRLRLGHGLVVHCGAGIGRAGTTAAALLVLAGMPLADALAHVRAHRPAAGPEVGAQRSLVEELAGGH